MAAINRVLAKQAGVKVDRPTMHPSATVHRLDNAALTRNIKAFPRKDQWTNMTAPTLGGR